MSLYPWEKHLTLISYQAHCVVWKDSTGVCFTTAYTGEKKLKKANKKQADMVLPVSPKVSPGNNCPILNICDVVPPVRRINRNNLLTKKKKHYQTKLI